MFFKLGKYFKLTKSSLLHRFLERWEKVSGTYLLGCFVKRDGSYQEVDRDLWVRMTRLRKRARGEIAELEVEWENPRDLRKRRDEKR